MANPPFFTPKYGDLEFQKKSFGQVSPFLFLGGGGRQLVKIRHKLNPAYEYVEKMAIILKKI
jgi:hypothetical protein